MKISIEGYKSIAAKRSVELPGLTILAGANSSGKSSFMQPFLLIKQTLENDFDAGALLLDGPNVKLTDSSEIVSRVTGEEHDFFSVGLHDGEIVTEVIYKFDQVASIVVESIFQKSNQLKNGIWLNRDSTNEEILSGIPADVPILVALAKTKVKPKLNLTRERCFLQIDLHGNRLTGLLTGFDPEAHLGNFAKQIIHVPGLRGNPERTYRTAAVAAISYPGSFEKYIASIIHHWQTDPKQKDKSDKLQAQLRHLGLASAVKASRLNDSRLELRISRRVNSPRDESDHVNIADVGFGVSQVLPVLVALLAANPNQLVYIEQPELHLHPRAQHAMAKLIADAIVERGIRVVIETHSAILIRGVQILVARGQFPAEKVSLNWFTQNLDSGQTDISEARLDKFGAFGDWPEDFDAVALDVERMYLDAVEEAIEHEV